VSTRILVVGGAGFVGSHLVERLVTTGARVEIVDNLVRGRREWLPSDASFHQADIRDQSSLQRIVGQVRPDVVFHLAALHFIPQVDGAPELAWEVNVEGTRNLLVALLPCAPQTLLFASTAAVYPDRAGPIAESCQAGPIDLYGKTKVEGERLVAQFETDTGTKSLIARIFNVIGRRETNPHVVPELVDQLRQGSSRVRLGNLNTRRDYTDAVDVAEALCRLIEPTVRHRIFNVGSGRGVSAAELVETCEEILGRRIAVEVDPGRLRAQDRRELVAEVGLLRDTTGWLPRRPLRRTLAELLSGE
jgi:UDP-glucose 4-epimerase